MRGQLLAQKGQRRRPHKRTSERVNIETRDPLESGIEGLDKLLLEEVVHANLALSLCGSAKGQRAVQK